MKMNKIIKTLAIFCLAIAINSCDQADGILYTGTAVGFSSSSAETSVPDDDITIQLPITVTTASSESRTFDVVASEESSNTDEFTLGQATVPANSYEGTVDVTFDFDAITGDDGDLKVAVIEIAEGDSYDILGDPITVNYFREIVCNDSQLTASYDDFPDESAFAIVNTEDDSVAFVSPINTSRAGSPESYDITLEDGCYELLAYDAYGDGGVVLNLTCSIITFASESGSFAGQVTPTAEQRAILDPTGYGAFLTAFGGTGGNVTVTPFCVNVDPDEED